MDKYCIIYKSSKNSLPIGDLFRVLFLLKDKKKTLLTNKNSFKSFHKFKDIKLDQIKHIEKYNKNFKIINLYLGYKIQNSYFDINNYINKKIDKKITYNIFKKLIKIHKQRKNLNILKKKNIKIGINWKTPSNWKIKSYPIKKWNKLVKMLQNMGNLRVSWQKGQTLPKYINWLDSCDLIVSVVGLGAHISSYLGRKTILLVGPTDFYESSFDNNIKKIYPLKRCGIHSKKINLFYKKCNCMNNISEIQIFNAIKKVIKEN